MLYSIKTTHNELLQSQKAAASNLAYLVLSEAVAIQQVGVNRFTYTVLHYNLIP